MEKKTIDGLDFDGKNIVLLVIDSVCADNLSCYGYGRETSPFISKLAEENIIFKNCFSAAPWSLPSHASILTGKYPSEHKCHSQNTFFDAETFISDLGDDHYKLGISYNPFISEEYGFGEDFDEFIDHISDIYLESENIGKLNSFTRLRNFNPKFEFFKYFYFLKEAILNSEWNSIKIGAKYVLSSRSWDFDKGRSKSVNDLAISKITENKEPFFLYLTYMEPHDYEVVDKDSLIIEWVGENRELNPRKEFLEPDYDDKKLIRAKYDASIRYTDDRVKELYTKITKKYPDTIFIITSDHGEELGHTKILDKELYGHQYTITERTIKVPLIIAGKSVPNIEINDVVSNKIIRELINQGRYPLEENVKSEYNSIPDSITYSLEKGSSQIINRIKTFDTGKIIRGLKEGFSNKELINKFRKNNSIANIKSSNIEVDNTHLPNLNFKQETGD